MIEFFKKGFKTLKFKRKKPSPFGELEEQIMEFLWKKGSGTVKEVRAYLGESRFAHTTVMTVMDRLYKKGILRREKEGKGYRYYPVMSKGAFEKEVAKRVVTDILRSSPSGVAAFEGVIEELSEEEIKKLREMIDKKVKNEKE
ncbi:BlaI/MecI/CopY family transcriptional regulator [Persephonella atlantica]|uniref:BlaI/MecI/CopY family transcriptional regulator n=1 Tax=Persephonella atlantica TaxID=2699429 RepID=A0ABS1GHN1_9AQUI|nr:BlaI/MecI/CopY family transcriptional regulator [Persephonella atlantica]MBK3332444.1 BlaI/MecI/CopY family transcriptional regulator [Persephonella atlantica]